MSWMPAAAVIRLWNRVAQRDSKKPRGLDSLAPRFGPGTARQRWCSVPAIVLVPLRPVPVISTRSGSAGGVGGLGTGGNLAVPSGVAAGHEHRVDQPPGGVPVLQVEVVRAEGGVRRRVVPAYAVQVGEVRHHLLRGGGQRAR